MKAIPANIVTAQLAVLPFYTEGPVLDAAGNLFFTTLAGGSIIKMDTTGQMITWAKGERPNGQVILPDGDHLVCDSKSGSIHRFDPDGRFVKHELMGSCAGHKVHAACDLVFQAGAGIYFTDAVRERGNVFFIGIDGNQEIVAQDIDFPNGLVLSHDQRSLFVAESYRNRILRIPLATPGVAAGPAEVWATLPVHPSGKMIDNLPDGLELDEEGYLLVAHYGMQAVQVLAPDGTWLYAIDTGLLLTSNVMLLQGEGPQKTIIVTGGYAEPGPGAVMRINIQWDQNEK